MIGLSLSIAHSAFIPHDVGARPEVDPVTPAKSVGAAVAGSPASVAGAATVYLRRTFLHRLPPPSGYLIPSHIVVTNPAGFACRIVTHQTFAANLTLITSSLLAPFAPCTYPLV